MAAHRKFQECIDKKDWKGVIYTLVDSLDIDPTFKKYKDDYKALNASDFPWGELKIKLSEDSKDWDYEYWVKLKLEFEKNPSKELFEHMRKVAKVVYAKKISRLERERAETDSVRENNSKKDSGKKSDTALTKEKIKENNEKVSNQQKKDQERIEQRKKEIEENNRKIQEEEKKKKEQKERQNEVNNPNPSTFQKVKANLIKAFSWCIDKLTWLLQKLPNGRLKRWGLSLMQRAKKGMANSKNLKIVDGEKAKKLGEEASKLKEQVDKMKSNEAFLCANIDQGLSSLYTTAYEAFSDMSQFLDNPENYLSVTFRDQQMHGSEEKLYSAPIATGGEIFAEVRSACQELIKVNAYNEALVICQRFLDKLNETKTGLSKDDVTNIDWSIAEMEKLLLNIKKQRDDYTSLRKATIAKFSMILKG